MKLSELFPQAVLTEDPEIRGLKTNSREVEPGDLFLCISGMNADRHAYLPDAIARGAVAAVISKDIDCPVPFVKVEDVNAVEDEVFDRFYD
ncbi:MAG: UDP-N-acetylmuramoyl-L-alanyl-D-glutamate--2,6-diaminopimelate ligase, partial [Erysipelotrichaceae bacterium]|nr:UDP-N-acetylmuramoyl-L-alanyl-D-glutamate--2,6-diaminopimelate ligase [Erysipelotrichaceae bacterium]